MAEKNEAPRERLTEELLERLLAAETPEAYLDEGLTIDRELPDYLHELLFAKGLKRADVVRARGAGGASEPTTLDGSGPFVRKRIPSKLVRRAL